MLWRRNAPFAQSSNARVRVYWAASYAFKTSPLMRPRSLT